MFDYRSLIQYPQHVDSFTLSIYVLRVLGLVTFVAYPFVLIASIMGLAAPGGGTKSLQWLSISGFTYPLVIIVLWWIAEKLNSLSPWLNFAITAIPVVVIYGLIVWSYGGDYLKEREKKNRVVEINQEILKNLEAGQYVQAFDVFTNPDRWADRDAISFVNDPSFNLHKLLLKTNLPEPLPEVFIRELMDYVFNSPLRSFNHFDNSFRNYQDPEADVSAKLIALIADWKNAEKLPRMDWAHQWILDHLELHAPEQKPVLQLREENPLTERVLGSYEKTVDSYLTLIDQFPTELLNKKSETFGTPLFFVLLDEAFESYEGNRLRAQALVQRGARLHESEVTPENQKLLAKLLK